MIILHIHKYNNYIFMIKIYSDKKVQEIESYLLNRHKPILLVIGTSGIGK